MPLAGSAATFFLKPAARSPPPIDWAAFISGVATLLVLAGLGVGLVVGLVVLIIRSRAKQSAARQAQEDAIRARWDSLVARFGQENAARICRSEIWRGQTLPMVIESMGRPMTMDEEVLKTKTKLMLKYNMIARGRYRTRVMLEDGIVVGWDQKGR